MWAMRVRRGVWRRARVVAIGAFASATHAMTRIMRLHQICCGYLCDEEGTLHHLENNRVKVMGEIIDEMTGKVAIWCAYQEDVRKITEYLEKEYPDEQVVQYYGGTSTRDRQQAISDFQDGYAKFWVATAATGGFGVTLTACHNVIYYSNSYDLEHRLQSEDRFHRIGQTRSVAYVDLVVPRTVDEKILKTLREKKTLAEAIAGDGARSWIS